jgi:hypothetical protein
MIGLAYLVFFAVYLLVSIAVVRGAIGYARKNGKSAKRWGWGAAIVMYSIVFWDWIPTVAVHQYYCAKDAGFWVYKTLDQWKAENPGVMEGLATQRVWQHDYAGGRDVIHINQRFDLVYNKKGEQFLHLWPDDRKLVDVKTGEMVAHFVDFNSYAAGWGDLKFWTSIQHCSDGQKNAINFGNFVDQFKGKTK